MILNKILESNPVERYRRLEKRLLGLGRDVRSFRKLTVPALYEMEQTLEDRLDQHKSKDLKFVLESQAYQRDLMSLKAAQLARVIKEARDDADVLTPGRTYYRDVKTVGNKLTGRRAQYINEGKVSDWLSFSEDRRIMKIMEVLTFGSDKDFRTLYVEMADGSPFASTEEYLQEHISKSSEAALNKMASYCNSRWEGPWPWEARTPLKVFSLIKEARMTRLEEIRMQLAESRRALQEGEVERAALVVKISGIRDKVESTIQSFGKMSGDFMTMGEEVAAELGDAAKQKMDHLGSDALRQLIDGLNQFQAAVGDVLGEINGDTTAAAPGDAVPSEFDDADPSMEPDSGEFGDETADAGMGAADGAGDDFDMDNVSGGEMGADAGMSGMTGLGDERGLR